MKLLRVWMIFSFSVALGNPLQAHVCHEDPQSEACWAFFESQKPLVSNSLVLGPVQNGKSTLINFLLYISSYLTHDESCRGDHCHAVDS